MPLEPQTLYAILFRHDAVAVPSNLLEAGLTNFGSDGLLANDYLSFFSTAGAKDATTEEEQGFAEPEREIQRWAPQKVDDFQEDEEYPDPTLLTAFSRHSGYGDILRERSTDG